jgi:MFS family permease
MIGYIIAAIFQPYFGALSDRTSTRIGKRKPFLLIGMPLTAIFFLLIPFESSFTSLLIYIIGFNLMFSVYRVPSMSLMPDVTPKKFWNTANGIINLIGGIGALISYFVGSMLYEIDKHYPFILVSVVLLICFFIIHFLIKEDLKAADEKKDKPMGALTAFKEILIDRDKSVLFLLFSIFFRFMGYNGIETFITLYGVNFLNVKAGDAGILLGIMALSFIIFAVPSGMIATKIGQKKTVIIGLILLTLVFLVDALAGSFLVIAVLGPFVGFAYALVNINAFPMLLGMGGEKKIGVYTGLYYFAYSIAYIIAPPLFGKIIDILGFGAMFYVSCILLICAILAFAVVKERMADRDASLQINSTEV